MKHDNMIDCDVWKQTKSHEGTEHENAESLSIKSSLDQSPDSSNLPITSQSESDLVLIIPTGLGKKSLSLEDERGHSESSGASAPACRAEERNPNDTILTETPQTTSRQTSLSFAENAICEKTVDSGYSTSSQSPTSPKPFLLPSNLKPYYADENNGIYIFHGDCREVLPTLPVVDLIATDPPYGVAYITSHRVRTDRLRKPVANDKNLDVVAEAWPLAMARLATDRHWYAFASPRRIAEADAIFGGSKHILAWDKGDRGTAGDLECGFGEAWEAIFYGTKGRRAINGKRPRTVIRYDWSGTMDPLHPTVKPIDLMGRIIKWSTSVGEIVLDPFMGSGPTLRAAKDLGRRAIGIETEERYCEIAANRLRQEVLFFAGGAA